MACSRSRRARSAQSARDVVSMPPSPVVSSLRGWNDQAAISAPAPTGRPCAVEPAAQAASSTTAMPSGSHSARIAPRSSGHAALVDGDHRAGARGDAPRRSWPAVRLPVAGSTSANTGVAPT